MGKHSNVKDSAADSRTLALGNNLKVVRKIVYRENLEEFSLRLNICVNTLRKMEAGHPGIAIGTWFQAFEIMQVATDVIEASRPAALLLAAQCRPRVEWTTGK